MSVAKTTVDKLLKGYDIRLRPDFGGTCHDYICLWGSGSAVEGLNNSRFGHDDIYESSLSRELPKSWPVAKKKEMGMSFEVTATMSLLCIYPHNRRWLLL